MAEKITNVGVFSSAKIYQEGIVDRLTGEPAFAPYAIELSVDGGFAKTVHEQHIVIIDDGYSRFIEIIRSLKQTQPSVRIVVLKLFDDIESICRCVDEGVDGFVSKHDSLTDLVECLQTVANNKKRYNEDIIQLLTNRISGVDIAAENDFLFSLTGRQKHVLNLIELGNSNKKIAQTLSIEVATVKNHVHTILEKLHVNNRCEAAAYLRRSSPRDQSISGQTLR